MNLNDESMLIGKTITTVLDFSKFLKVYYAQRCIYLIKNTVKL